MPGQEDLAEFLAKNKVRVVASLPCYSEANVDAQRGKGVFGRSILGLQLLNSQGFGMPGSGLKLDLVYNPSGASLPPNQGTLEGAYKEKLAAEFDIQFSNLLTITNMPIKRFADQLMKKGELEAYMNLLVNNFNPTAAGGVMCRDTLSVGWDGQLYDCDFNQQLAMSLGEPLADVNDTDGDSASEKDSNGKAPSTASSTFGVNLHKGKTVFDIMSASELLDKEIVVDHHCFGCTAGTGSGCQGATA